MLLAGSMLSNILFGIIGAPIVYHMLGKGPDMVGKLSLMIGGGYLLGNLTNRLFINKISGNKLVKIGLKIYAIALVFMGICVFLKLFIPAVATIFLISYACGFIFPNTLAKCLTMHKEYLSFTAASQGSFMLFFVSIWSYAISRFKIISTPSMLCTFIMVLVWLIFAYALSHKIEKIKA